MTIQLLPEDLINQIAAGEVVERPASVVRELVDNALDAGASKISILLKDGGKQLIRVEDNGCGMHPEDARKCIERHATSKIQTESDLYDVQTLGFRGEALPSIGSVSRLEIKTRPESAEVGTQILVEAGALRENQPVGMPVGTEINVRNLFYNVPVRRKFLRASATEMGHCMDIVLKAAMSRPDVAFHLAMDDRTLIRVKAPVPHEQRIQQLLGSDGRNLWSVHAEDGPLRVHGFISNPNTHRSSAKNSLFSHVNGRHIQEPMVRRAVSQGYSGCIPKGRYPVCVFYIEVPAHQVDVNAHPAKTEVRFRDPLAVSRLIVDAIRSRLDSENVRRIPTFEPPPVQERLAAHPKDAAPFTAQQEGVASTSDLSTSSPPTSSTPTQSDAAHLAYVPSPMCAVLGTPFDRFSQAEVFGQLGTECMVVAFETRLFIVDLMRALRWLTLHDLRSAQAIGDAAHQSILQPRPIAISAGGMKRLETSHETLETIGLRFTALTPTSLVVNTLPGPVDPSHATEVIHAAAKVSPTDANSDLLQPRFETAIASASIQSVPKLSRYDLRTICASLDEVIYHAEWGTPRFIVEVKARP